MATDITNQSELDAFKLYIDERCGGSLNGHSLAEAIGEFREYQQQLTALREKLRLSEESAERDGTILMTDKVVEERYRRLNAELAKEEIID